MLVDVRAKKDHECITHFMKKGKTYRLEEDQAKALEEMEAVEILVEPEKAEDKPKTEKRQS